MPRVLIVCGIVNNILDYKDMSIILEKIFNEKNIDKKNDIYVINPYIFDNNYEKVFIYSKRKNIKEIELKDLPKNNFNVKFDYIIFNYCPVLFVINKIKIFDYLYNILNKNGKLIFHNGKWDFKKIVKEKEVEIRNKRVKYSFQYIIKYINNLFNYNVKVNNIKLKKESKYFISSEYKQPNIETIDTKLRKEIYNKEVNIFQSLIKKYKNNKVKMDKIINLFSEKDAKVLLANHIIYSNIYYKKDKINQLYTNLLYEMKDHNKYLTNLYSNNKKVKNDNDNIIRDYVINYWEKKE